MKNIVLITNLLLGMLFIACSEKETDENILASKTDSEIPFSVNLETRELPVNTSCILYVYAKDAGENDYLYKEKIFLSKYNLCFKFKYADIIDKEFRFLFIASDSEDPEIYPTDKNTGSLSENTTWGNTILRSRVLNVTEDNYYKIIDRAGNLLAEEKTIHATLTRMVGQILLDISRIDGTLENLVDIRSEKIKSVLDRVFKIEIQYTGLTKDLAFSDDNESLISINSWTDLYTEIIEPTLENDSLVVIPQTGKGLEISGWNTKGSVRIKGAYCLPSDKNIKVKFIFHYFDTSPACEDPKHAHNITCYTTRQLVLNIPKDDSSYSPISVKQNYFTLNKAGIHYDRIIDLDMEGSFGFLADWANENTDNN